MNEIIDIENCNQKLEYYKGANAKIWTFDKTFGRLLLRLWRFDKDKSMVYDEIFVAALACEYITGPFSWKEANIRIEKSIDESSNEPLFIAIDEKASFKLISSGGIGLIEQDEFLSK